LEVLLLDCLANQCLHLRGVELSRCFVDQLAIAHHDDFGVVALDLHDILKHLAHLREMRAVVWLYLEHTGVVVKRDDAELVRLGQAWTLSIELVRGWHYHRLSPVEDDVCRIRIIVFVACGTIKLDQSITRWGP